MRSLVFLILGTFLFQRCATNSMVLERNESLMQSNFKEIKIVCIDPRFYFEEDEKNYDLQKTENLTSTIKKDILFSARKNKIELSLYDIANISTTAYQDLLPLKQNMLDANFSQATPLNFNSSNYKRKTIQKRVFVYPPKISYEFSSMSQKYGTPLFSYIGIYNVRQKLVLYHVVVDTDRSETVYRESKVVEGKVNSDKIAQMIYDSYATLRNELLKK